MFDIDLIKKIDHHKAMNEIVDLLCHKTGNVNRTFFQAEVAYFLSLIPSSMRAIIISPERGRIPINVYSIALATSGFGKGYSISVMEEITDSFRREFIQRIFPVTAETSLHKLAVDIATAKSGDETEEFDKLETDFKRQGNAPFNFDSGTSPAIKQLRYKLQLANIGAINFQMDEIGSNLQGNTEVLNTLLEMYDLGKVKTKLIKNTAEQERGIDLTTGTPSNMLMFGTTSKLFDGSKTEEEFYAFLEMGYARRCFFGLGKPTVYPNTLNPEDVYDSLVSKNKNNTITYWKNVLAGFADPKYHNLEISVPKEVGVELVAYRLYCENLANNMPEHEVIRKAEISHRYFKALKLAGVYAFLDKSKVITETNLKQAIKLAEENGRSFSSLLQRERNFVRLAKYIAESSNNLTHADLVEDLPYYPSSTTHRKEIMDLAMAWGIGNHVVIKKEIISGVEFFSGSTLQETDTNKLIFSFSDHFASDYEPQKQPLDKLPKLLKADGLHWCNHHFNKQHRSEDNIIEGFNLLVVDVDGGVKLDLVHKLLSNYTYITHTTKRHTDEENRFRLIMPTNYNLNLSKEEYAEFMDNFLLWLPFDSDQTANQRSKKWMSNSNSIIKINKGKQLIDVLPFIPKTKKNSEYVNSIINLDNMGHLERWFLSRMDMGNRNNILIKFALMLKDTGLDYPDIADKVYALNNQSSSPLKKTEIQNTILKSIANKI